MPGLKRTTIKKRRYGGNGGHLILNDALNFYFQIMAQLYTDKHQSFIAPNADIFYTYAASIDYALSKTYIQSRTPSPRQISPSRISPYYLHFWSYLGRTDLADLCKSTTAIFTIVIDNRQ